MARRSPVLGVHRRRQGSARTDKDGRFTWAPAPQAPFQMIVVLSGGQVARPILVEALQQGTTVIEVRR